MIAHLHGTVAGISPDGMVIDVGGVGCGCSAPPDTLATLKPGELARVATSLVVREDSLTLFGSAPTMSVTSSSCSRPPAASRPRLALAMLAVHSHGRAAQGRRQTRTSKR